MGYGTLVEEIRLDQAEDGGRADVVAEVMVFNHQAHAHLCRTRIHGSKFIFKGELDHDTLCVTVWNGRVHRSQGRTYVHVGHDGILMQRKGMQQAHMSQLVEFCAGIRAVSRGYEACGVKTVIRNDVNPRFCQWIHDAIHEGILSPCKVLLGDVGSDDTVRSTPICGAEAGIVSAGIACQPYSKIGDQREHQDERSKTLPDTLRQAFLLQCPVVVLECVKEAAVSPFVQDQIKQFCVATGFACKQVVLELHVLWPSRRTRWWCVLHHPAMKVDDLKTLPQLPFAPVAKHLTDCMFVWEEAELNQLLLDVQELRIFEHAKGGIIANMVNPNAPLQTALHSWGSQCRECQCGCRSTGFHPQRLQEKGLYGAVIPVPGVVQTESGTFAKMRHLHPKEIALFNGLHPKHVHHDQIERKPTLRLEMAGVGQMASPLQSGWIIAQTLRDTMSMLHQDHVETPKQTLLRQCDELFRARDDLRGQRPKTNDMLGFEQALAILLGSHGDAKIEIAREETRPAEPGPSGQLNNIVVEEKEKKFRKIQVASQSCGVAGFEVKQIPIESQVPNEPTPTIPFEIAAPELRETTDAEAESPELQSESIPSNVESQRQTCRVWISDGDEMPHDIQVRSGLTVGQVAANAGNFLDIQQPINLMTVVGTSFPLSRPVSDGMVIILRDGAVYVSKHCPCKIQAQGVHVAEFQREVHTCKWLTRQEVLFRQEGTVADDEMRYYLKSIAHDQVKEAPILTLRHAGFASEDFTEWILKVEEICEQEGQSCISAIWCDHHWMPAVIKRRHSEWIIVTTPEAERLLAPLATESMGPGHPVAFECRHSVSEFPADCGFQTLQWILATASHSGVLKAMSAEEAISWRLSFLEYVSTSRERYAPREIASLLFGGGNQDATMLPNLLQSHGVAPHRIQECAQHLTQHLGAATIDRILQSPDPWKDLKAKASALKPPIKIVHADELRVVVAKRIEAKQSFGNRDGKIKIAKKEKAPLTLRPEQIAIPTGVFAQEGGEPMEQVPLTKLSPHNPGIAVADIDEALRFLNMQRPAIAEGAAVIVLEMTDPRLPENAEQVRFPAMCVQTQEPILLHGAIIQLGAKKVGRTSPTHQVQVKEAENLVVRALAYRDEWGESWEDFVKGPVRAILNASPCAHLQDADVLDVWDRQFLDAKFGRAPPTKSEIFSVLVRIIARAAKIMVADSGQAGLYFEPRSENGRQPCNAYKVVWIPRKAKQEVLMLQTQLKHKSEVVRYGQRYGLRVENGLAEETHQFLRPEVAFLNGEAVESYKVGPLPFGTTKQGMMDLMKEWKWPARPVQPTGQSQDNTGVFWQVHATAMPSHWIYQLAHGDVLISRDTRSRESPSQGKLPVVAASRRTLNSLRASPTSASEDPWLHSDPWSGAREKPKPSAAMSQQQMQTMEEKVEKKVLRALNEKSGDQSMQVDGNSRIDDLESRVSSLAANLNMFQQQQQQHNQSLQTQIAGVHAQVEAQANAFGVAIETKLNDQMSKIEALLRKRSHNE